MSVTGWRKSSFSSGYNGCIAVGSWRKSSRSHANGHCAEVGCGPSGVGVRDSKDPASPVLVFRGEDWSAFLSAVKLGTVAS